MIQEAEDRGLRHLVAIVGNELQETEGIGGSAHLQIKLPGKPTLLVHYVWQEQDESSIFHHSQPASATFRDRFKFWKILKASGQVLLMWIKPRKEEKSFNGDFHFFELLSVTLAGCNPKFFTGLRLEIWQWCLFQITASVNKYKRFPSLVFTSFRSLRVLSNSCGLL